MQLMLQLRFRFSAPLIVFAFCSTFYLKSTCYDPAGSDTFLVASNLSCLSICLLSDGELNCNNNNVIFPHSLPLILKSVTWSCRTKRKESRPTHRHENSILRAINLRTNVQDRTISSRETKGKPTNPSTRKFNFTGNQFTDKCSRPDDQFTDKRLTSSYELILVYAKFLYFY